MLLGQSGKVAQQEISLDLVAGRSDIDGGVEHGGLLVRLCDAVTLNQGNTAAEVRAEAIEAMGINSVVDAVAVIALFQMMNRVANATGTPLDEFMVAPGNAISTQTGSDDFNSRADTPDTRTDQAS